MGKGVYLDYSAGQPTDKRVVDAMLPYFERDYGNPSSLHTCGGPVRTGVERAREQVAKLIGSPEPKFVIFTSGATESNNLAIKGLAHKRSDKGKHIITSMAEHMSILNVCKALEKEGFKVTYLPIDKEAFVPVDAIEKAMKDDTILVTLGYANSEVGTIQDIKAIGELCTKKKVALHVDAVQSAGRVPIDVKSEHIDLLTLSSNDLYGPKGAGALYVAKGVDLVPIIDGGGQERRLRSGSENVPGIVGMGKAAEIALAEMPAESKRLKALRDKMIDEVLSRIPASHLNGHRTKRLPQNANMRFSYIEGEALILNLDMVGIYTSTSSACTSKTLEPSHVLRAMGIPHEEAHSALLLNLGRWSTEEDVDLLIKELPEIVYRLRELSPLTPKGLYDSCDIAK